MECWNKSLEEWDLREETPKFKCAKLVIYHGRIDFDEYGYDMLVAAVIFCKNNVVELLLNKMKSSSMDDDGEFIYLAISSSVNTKSLQLLLSDGRSEPNAQNSKKLIIVVKDNNANCMTLLLEDGRADPTAKDNEAIHIASTMGHSECLSLLIKDGRANLVFGT